jgi:hypothetical protein
MEALNVAGFRMLVILVTGQVNPGGFLDRVEFVPRCPAAVGPCEEVRIETIEPSQMFNDKWM